MQRLASQFCSHCRKQSSITRICRTERQSMFSINRLRRTTWCVSRSPLERRAVFNRAYPCNLHCRAICTTIKWNLHDCNGVTRFGPEDNGRRSRLRKAPKYGHVSSKLPFYCFFDTVSWKWPPLPFQRLFMFQVSFLFVLPDSFYGSRCCCRFLVSAGSRGVLDRIGKKIKFWLECVILSVWGCWGTMEGEIGVSVCEIIIVSS